MSGDIMAAPRPVSIFEAYDRFNRGKKVREDTWDYVTIPTNALAMKDRYDIRFDKGIIPEDEGLIDRLFLAGMDMLVTTGFYCPDIGRTMEITEEEVYEGIKKAPTRLKLGKGKDKVKMKPRRGNAPSKPVVEGGPTGAPVSEDIFLPMMQGYAQEATVDTLVSGVLSTLDGHPSTTNTPYEIMATMAEIRLVREAMARANRPGMCI
jgi:methylamine--corrinoid protein Co-methyltransferase